MVPPEVGHQDPGAQFLLVYLLLWAELSCARGSTTRSAVTGGAPSSTSKPLTALHATIVVVVPGVLEDETTIGRDG